MSYETPLRENSWLSSPFSTRFYPRAFCLYWFCLVSFYIISHSLNMTIGRVLWILLEKQETWGMALGTLTQKFLWWENLMRCQRWKIYKPVHKKDERPIKWLWAEAFDANRVKFHLYHWLNMGMECSSYGTFNRYLALSCIL